MLSPLTSGLPSVLSTAAAPGRLPSTTGRHRSGHDYGGGEPCPSPQTLSWVHILAYMRLGGVKEPAGQAPSLSWELGGPHPSQEPSGPASGRREGRGQGGRPNRASSARRQTACSERPLLRDLGKSHPPSLKLHIYEMGRIALPLQGLKGPRLKGPHGGARFRPTASRPASSARSLRPAPRGAGCLPLIN